MKKTLLFAGLMLSSSLLWSQLEINLEIEFSHSQRDYESLTEYTNITEGLGAWDDNSVKEEDSFFELSIPFVMPGFEDRPMDFIEIGSSPTFTLEYDEWPDDPYEILLFALASDLPVLSPLNDSANTDQGHILFYEGDGVLRLEYQNVALEVELYLGDGSLISRVNIIMEFDYESRCMEYHYGPSVISPQLQEQFQGFWIVGTIFGWFFEEFDGANIFDDWLHLVGILSGDPSKPEFEQFLDHPDFDGDLTFLNSFPEEGTVYQFCYDQTTSVDETIAENMDQLTLYPNPATDIVQIKTGTDSRIQQVLVYDQMGRVVSNTKGTHEIDVSLLSSGLYVIGVEYDGEGGFRYGKLVVE